MTAPPPPFRISLEKPGEVNFKMANNKLLWIGFICTVVTVFFVVISFASPYWLETWPGSFNEFRNLGLWEICMDKYMHHKDDSQDIYSGCWWVFNMDTRYWKLRDWLLPRKI